DTVYSMRDLCEAQIEAAFHQQQASCIVLTRGPRIVGASLLSFDPSDANHLLSGPAIMSEFRNRGLGTLLLHSSLWTLREAGLDRVHGVTKQGVPTAKFLYPKFGSAQAP